MKRGAVLSSLASAETAGEEVLLKGGSALKAALTGFFVAAGENPGVLLGPVSLLVAGLGSGARAYDGRARQPGVGGKRPRGFLPNEEIPAAASVAVPASIAAISVACAYASGTSLLACARPGVAAAKRQGAEGRAALLENVATMGALAFSQPSVKRAWIGEFGATEGGLIGPGDLTPPAELDGPATLTEQNYEVPWRGDVVDADTDAALGAGHVLVAADAAGLFVALAFRELDDRVRLDPYEVGVPRLAEPVLRGVSRAKPGASIASPAELEIEKSESGALVAVRARTRADATTEYCLVRDVVSHSITSLRR